MLLQKLITFVIENLLSAILYFCKNVKSAVMQVQHDCNVYQKVFFFPNEWFC